VLCVGRPAIRRSAIRYTPSRWEALTLVLRDGRTCIDNNAAKRSIGPIYLRRKNWLFAGSDVGGERAAAASSLIEIAKLNGFDAEDYLRQVLARIADQPIKRVDELLPWMMDSVRSEHVNPTAGGRPTDTYKSSADVYTSHTIACRR
jgi:hypothetical protein